VRVLHAFKIYRPDVEGGIPEAIGALAAGMRPRKQSRILVARARGFGRRYAVDGIAVDAVGSLGSLLSAPLAPSFPWALAQRARAADLVALHHPFPLNDLGILRLPQRAALVIHWHGEIVGRGALGALVAPLIRRSVARAQRIVVSDESLVANSPFLSAHAEKCAVVPFGIDTAYWGSLDAAGQRQAADLRLRHRNLVVSTGRLVPYKGYAVLVEALRHVDATVIIVGEGPLRASLLAQARERGVADRLILSGTLARDELKAHLHAARAFVFSSDSPAETFGIAQIEAMAACLPLVNTALPTGVPHVARDGREALTVPPGDAVALAGAIARLLGDDDLARRLGEGARTRARAEYEQAVFVRRVEAVYDEAMRELR
jgi:glycosyltransferase involved in cell wall biosynthesis